MILLTFTPEEGKALLDSLALDKFQLREQHSKELTQDIHDIHRRYNFQVCRWLQAQGWRHP